MESGDYFLYFSSFYPFSPFGSFFMYRIDAMAPDLAFVDVTVVPNSCLERKQKIGEGGFGIVYKVSFIQGYWRC